MVPVSAEMYSSAVYEVKGLRCSSQTLTHSQPEAVEGVSVDAVQLAHHSNGEFHNDSYLSLLPVFVLKTHRVTSRVNTAAVICLESSSVVSL